MDILHYISSVRLEAGGPGEGLRRIIDAYLKDGHHVEVLSLDPPDDPAFADIPVPVHGLGSTGKYSFSPDAIPWLKANIGRFEGIILHGLWQYQGLSTLLAIPKSMPYAVFTHGMLDPWFNRKYPLKYMKKLPYWLLVERQVLKRARRVLFTSETERDLAATSFPFPSWRSRIVPYGTAGPTPGRDKHIEAFYRVCPQVRDEPFILFAARIHEKKGCDLLIEAYGQFAKSGPVPWLVVAGPDESGLKERLQSQARSTGIADRIVWPGMLRGDEKWGAFEACEAFILPSHQENFGIAVAEAMSCVKPVLISDQVNICGQILDEGAGLVAPDTVAGTLSLLERWRDTSEEERERMGRNGRRTFEDYYDTQQTARATVVVLSEP